MRIVKVLLPCLILFAISASGFAEERFIIGTQWDFAGGETNGSITSGQLQNALAPYYAVYPSFDVKSLGKRTQFDIQYGALGERFESQTPTTAISHTVRGGYDIRVSKRLKLSLSGYFSTVPDFTSYSVIKGVVAPSGEFQFVFQPALAKSSMHTGNGGIGVVYDLNYRSYFSVSSSATSLRFVSQDILSGLLYNQLRTDASASFGYKLSPHQTIDVKYLIVENQFQGAGKGRSQSVALSYTRQFSPVLEVMLGGGPAISYFQNSPNYHGYIASASLVRKIKSSTLSANYYHTPGDSSGLGTLSNTHSGGIAIFSPLSKSISLGWNISGFRGSTVGTLQDYYGVYSALDLSHELSRRWLVALGGAYRLNIYSGPINQEYKRIYISLRYRAPDLWRPSL